MREPINAFQRAALEVYADGDFSYIDSYDYADEHGDSLLSFILAELSDNEDCENFETAIQRIRSGIDDLQTVLDALRNAS